MFILTRPYLAADEILNPIEILRDPFEHYAIPLDEWISGAIDILVDNYRPFFQTIRAPIQWVLGQAQALLLQIPPLVVILVLTTIAWQIAGRKVAAFTLTVLLLIGLVQAWEPAMVSLSLVLTAVVFCIVSGIPIGLLCAGSDRVESVARPFLDAMQTLPTFVYLVPVVMLFGIGDVSGVIATIIFAVPPLIRLTNLGIRQIPKGLVEAGLALGLTGRQVLWKIQIPVAKPTIMAGVNQTVLFALSMSVIASMIGVPGLGQLVLQGISRLDVGRAAVGGLSIVLLAMVLDRITQTAGQLQTDTPWYRKEPLGWVLGLWSSEAEASSGKT